MNENKDIKNFPSESILDENVDEILSDIGIHIVKFNLILNFDY